MDHALVIETVSEFVANDNSNGTILEVATEQEQKHSMIAV